MLKHEYSDADWQTQKIGIAHSKVDDDTLKWEIHEMYSSGELSDYTNMALEFKRQKEKTAKK